jgi:hypothetical protein
MTDLLVFDLAAQTFDRRPRFHAALQHGPLFPMSRQHETPEKLT